MGSIINAILSLTTVFFSFSGVQTIDAPDVFESVVIEDECYSLSFYDDFEKAELDETKWEACPEIQRQNGACRWDNSMSYLDGKGNLVVAAYVDDEGNAVSGAVRTKDKFSQAGGYYEIRCKLQSSPGFWGAFWLMCNAEDAVGNGASDGIEIDIFESYDVEGSTICHAMHWDGYGEHLKSLGTHVPANCYDGEYHTFSLLWSEEAYVYYIDGKESYRVQKGDDNYPGYCEIPAYMKITTEFGDWAGKYDKNKLPDGIVVDYVKVYAKKE